MSTKTSSNDAAPKRAPGEGVAAEPTIIAEQHRKPNKGPATVPKGSSDAAQAPQPGKSGKE
ncbi:hypothetical protein [Comamonas terrigena]|uniref:hypothetical protein n=1 Tax=Comamonas terrigena TaxID=32013 RepID=UPI00289AC485|nr:hypothetical protein [Comamonas terrigena]